MINIACLGKYWIRNGIANGSKEMYDAMILYDQTSPAEIWTE